MKGSSKTLTELKVKSSFSGLFINSIVFYIHNKHYLTAKLYNKAIPDINEHLYFQDKLEPAYLNKEYLSRVPYYLHKLMIK